MTTWSPPPPRSRASSYSSSLPNTTLMTTWSPPRDAWDMRETATPACSAPAKVSSLVQIYCIYNICLNPDSCSTKHNLLIQTFSTWTFDLFGKQDYVDAMCKDCTFVYSLSLSLFCPWNKTEKPSKLCWSSFAYLIYWILYKWSVICIFFRYNWHPAVKWNAELNIMALMFWIFSYSTVY
jgi:hypothetical protein